MSGIRVLGHPVHPMLVMFPVALFITGLVFDIVHAISNNEVYGQVGFWTITAGLMGGVLAAATGLADWMGIPTGTRARAVGVRHAVLNVAVMVLFIVSWLGRVGSADHAPGWWVWLEVIGVVVAGASAWLGGELVNRHGIGVDSDAGPDASSSLTAMRRP
jgi:uncharacterized membrane protein